MSNWVLITFVALACVAIASCDKLNVLHEWKYVDFVWLNANQKQEAIRSGNYVRNATLLFDVQRVPDGRTFVTAVRNKGVPASLMTISDKIGDGGPLLTPYPNWKWTSTRNCQNIISVYRVALDICNRLWVLDCGYVGSDSICPAKLLVFDLRSNKLLKTIVIPDRFAKNAAGVGLLVTPIVITMGPLCGTPNVYMADSDGRGMVIYNGRNIWRLESDTFNPDKNASDYSIAGDTFHLEDGVVGMALTPSYSGRPQVLYYRPMSSFDLYAVDTKGLLRSEYGYTPPYRQLLPFKLPSQSAAMAISSNDILFMSFMSQTAIACYNVNTKYDSEHVIVVAEDSETLQFPAGMKVIESQGKENLMLLTNRYQKAATGTWNDQEVNIRILCGSVSDLVEGTKCAVGESAVW